jgi:hypothetical protein
VGCKDVRRGSHGTEVLPVKFIDCRKLKLQISKIRKNIMKLILPAIPSLAKQIAKYMPSWFTGKLIIALPIFLLSLSSYGGANSQAASQGKAPHKIPTRPKLYPPAVAHELDGAFWRTDGGFRATIRVTNIVQTAPIKVTPVLFMADGTEYILPEIKLQPAGVATVSINDALSNAPPEITAHLSHFGSAALRFQWSWASAISGTIRNLDVQRSLTHSNPFRLSMATDVNARAHRLGAGKKRRVKTNERPLDLSPKAVSIEGLWWKRGPEDGGFVVLTNRSSAPNAAVVKVFASGDKSEYNTSVSLLPHQTQQVDLKRAFNDFSSGAQSGGIRIQYQGVQGSILATGGMENVSVGYSAKIPFGYVPASDVKLGSWTMASVGLMHGPPDPMMQFPADTRFTSYAVLRNISAQPLQVTPTVYVTPGRQATTPEAKEQTLSFPALTLNPGETRNVDLEGLLEANGLKNINAGLTLSLGVSGVPGGLLAAIGSVDQSGDYVFEVEPHPVSSSLSKSLCFFEVGQGADTMVSLWNHSDQPEDLLATLFFEGGHYKLPVHLASKQSAMFNVLEIIKAHSPDADGNTIPSSVTRGSAVISGPQDETQKIDVSINAATFSVRAATCDPICQQCMGFDGIFIEPDSLSLAVGDSQSVEVIGNYSTGYQQQVWAALSSSDESVATVSGDTITAVGGGVADITADANLATDGTACPYEFSNDGDPMYCPMMADMGADASVAAQMPDHLTVLADVTVTLNCGANPSSQGRSVTYFIKDQEDQQMLSDIQMRENVPTTVSSCNGNVVQTLVNCTSNTFLKPNNIGEFTDFLSPGCPSSPSNSPCGYTFANQQWQWCPSSSVPKSMGTIGAVKVQNTLITIDGNVVLFPGTIFPK